MKKSIRGVKSNMEEIGRYQSQVRLDFSVVFQACISVVLGPVGNEFAKICLLASACLSVFPLVSFNNSRKAEWRNMHVILYFGISLKFVDIFQCG
jgi:hypothetical protein